MAKPKQENETLIAALSYIVIGILWWLIDENYKKNEYVKFHIKQSLILLIAGVIVRFAGWVPFSGNLISTVGSIFVFILMILGIVNAAKGQKKELPLLGQFAKNLNF